jgi:hypothetical protein
MIIDYRSQGPRASKPRSPRRYAFSFPSLFSSILCLGSYGIRRNLSLLRTKFIINASQPASDKIFDVSAFEKFLQDKIKVDGRVGNLGDIVEIKNVGDGKIEVVAHTQFSGRYLKYL